MTMMIMEGRLAASIHIHTQVDYYYSCNMKKWERISGNESFELMMLWWWNDGRPRSSSTCGALPFWASLTTCVSLENSPKEANIRVAFRRWLHNIDCPRLMMNNYTINLIQLSLNRPANYLNTVCMLLSLQFLSFNTTRLSSDNQSASPIPHSCYQTCSFFISHFHLKEMQY